MIKRIFFSLLVFYAIVFVGSALYLLFTNTKTPSQRKPIYSVVYDETGTFVSMPREGVRMNLPLGWRILTVNDSPNDVQSSYFLAKLDDGQAGNPWFSYFAGDQQGIKYLLGHFLLVSPEVWNKRSVEPSSVLNQYGYLGSPVTVNELFREFDVVFLKKQKNISLKNSLSNFDSESLTSADLAFKEGRASKEFLEDAKQGFFGRYKNKEYKELPNGITTALFSNSEIANSYDNSLILAAGCDSGSKILAINAGPFAQNDGKDYLPKLEFLRDHLVFNRDFCK